MPKWVGKKFFNFFFHLLKNQLLQLLPIAKMSSNTQDLVLAYINDYVSRNEELSKLKKALSKFLAGKELPKVSKQLESIIDEVENQEKKSKPRNSSSEVKLHF